MIDLFCNEKSKPLDFEDNICDYNHYHIVSVFVFMNQRVLNATRRVSCAGTAHVYRGSTTATGARTAPTPVTSGPAPRRSPRPPTTSGTARPSAPKPIGLRVFGSRY